MNSPRTSAIHLLAVALVLTAGCSGFDSAGPGERQYYVRGNVVESAPSNATVIPANDSRIDLEPIQRVIGQSVESGRGDSLLVNESTYRRIAAALETTPLYENDPEQYTNATALYVRSNGTTVRVSIYSGVPM